MKSYESQKWNFGSVQQPKVTNPFITFEEFNQILHGEYNLLAIGDILNLEVVQNGRINRNIEVAIGKGKLGCVASIRLTSKT